MISQKLRLNLALYTSLIAVVLSNPAAADSVADFYKGKTINLWVGYGTGGGYDTTARVVARHFGKHVPGNPNVVVQNVTGAGSLLAANNLYNIAPKDGSVLGIFSSTVAMLPLYGDPKAKFETLKFSWIGNIHRDTLACGVWKGAGQNIKTLEDLIAAKQTVVFGSDGGDAPPRSSQPSMPPLSLPERLIRLLPYLAYLPMLAALAKLYLLPWVRWLLL